MEDYDKNPKEWLLRVGKIRRKILLEKWKMILERRGLSRKDVYNGMMQLISRPQVLLTSIGECPRSEEKDKSTEREESSPKKSVNRGTADVEVDKQMVPVIVNSSIKSLSQESSINREDKYFSKINEIPELLAENVGNRINTINVKMPRAAITLNLNSHGSLQSKKELKDLSPAPEVINDEPNNLDEKTSARGSPENNIWKNDRLQNASPPKRPRITEDIYYIEGELFDKTRYSNSSDISCQANLAKKDQLSNKNFASVDEMDYEDTNDNISIESCRKFRVLKKMREIFGSVLTTSEIQEESEILEESLPKKRRKESRLSMDSGVCLSEAHSERISASPDTEYCDKRSESLDNRLEAVKNELSSINSEYKSCEFDLSVRSMPHLDTVTTNIISNSQSCSKKLHSSANILDNIDHEKSRENVKITIPSLDMLENVGPICVEFDLSSGKYVSTSNVLFPSDMTNEKKSNENDEELTELLDMDLNRDYQITLQGNTISIQEDYIPEVIPLREAIDTESSVVPIAASIVRDSNALTSQLECESMTQVDSNIESSLSCKDMDQRMIFVSTEPRNIDRTIDSIHESISSATEMCDTKDRAVESQDSNQITVITFAPKDSNNKVSSDTDSASGIRDTGIKNKSLNVDYSPEIEDTTIKKVSTNVQVSTSLSEEDKIVQDISSVTEAMETVKPESLGPVTTPVISATTNTETPPIPMPKLRVVHHSELGSRWCPTPVVESNSSIIEADKFVVPQLPPPITTISQHVPVNGLSSNQLDYIEYLVMHAASMSTVNRASALAGINSSNTCNIPETQTTCIPRESLVHKEQTNHIKTPILRATNVTANTPNNYYELDAVLCYNSKLLNNIFSHLQSVRWCIIRCQFVPRLYDFDELKKEFFEYKTLLCRQLVNLCNVLRSSATNFIINCLTRYYESLMKPEMRIFTWKDIYYIVTLKELPLLNYALPISTDPPYYCNAVSVPHNNTQSSANNFQQPFANNVQQPLANNVQQPLANNVQQPLANNVQQPLANNVQQPLANNVQQPSAHTFQRPSLNVQQSSVHTFQQPSSSLQSPLRKKVSQGDSKAEHRKNSTGSKKVSTLSNADTTNEVPVLSQRQWKIIRRQIIEYEDTVRCYHRQMIALHTRRQMSRRQDSLLNRSIPVGMNQVQPTREEINPANKQIGQPHHSPIARQESNNLVYVNPISPTIIKPRSTYEYQQISGTEEIIDLSNANRGQIVGGPRGVLWNTQTSLPVPVENINTQRDFQVPNAGIQNLRIYPTLRPELSSTCTTSQQNRTDQLIVSTNPINIPTPGNAQLQFLLKPTFQQMTLQQQVVNNIQNSENVQHQIRLSPTVQQNEMQPVISNIPTSENTQLQSRLSPTVQQITLQQQILSNIQNPENAQHQIRLSPTVQQIEIQSVVSNIPPPENAQFQFQLSPTVEQIAIRQPVVNNIESPENGQLQLRLNPTVQQIEIQPVLNNMPPPENAQFQFRSSPAIQLIETQQPILSNISIPENPQHQFRLSLTVQEPVLSNIPASMGNSDTQIPIIPEAFKVLNSKPTDILKSTNIETTEQIKLNPPATIGQPISATISKVDQKAPRDDCNERIDDVPEESADFSCPKMKNLKSCSFSSLLETPQIEPLPVESVPIDSVITSDVEKIEKVSEVNNNCASFQSIDESTEATEYPMSTITIQDDDENSKLTIVDSPEVIAVSADDVVTETVEESKVETIPDIVETETENQEETIDEEAYCSKPGSSKEIEENQTEIFSILDVKSISKDVFNNMGESQESEPIIVENIQRPTEIEEVVDITETLPNCLLCDRPSIVVCEQCCLAYYCSLECHQAHWAIHYKTCKPD